MRMLKAIGIAVAALALTWSAPVRAQDASLEALYASVARNVSTAQAGRDVPWQSGDKRGVIHFTDAGESCFEFTVRQTEPQPQPQYRGEVCTAETGAKEVRTIAPDAALPPRAGPQTRGLRPTPPTPPAGPGGSAAVRIKPVVVQINRQTERENRNGGHAVVLLTQNERTRNAKTCNALLRHFDDASIEQVRVGIAREPDGSLRALRPIYWPINERLTPARGDRCTARLSVYDYSRAGTIKRKLGLAGAGPYLVVSRSDEQQAATIDLSGLSNAQIDQMIVYFRDAFSQRESIWDRDRFNPGQEEQTLKIALGGSFSSQVLMAIGFINAPAITAGCSLGDMRDRPCR